MVATNPQFSLFKLELPKDFFKDKITKKYDEWLNIMPLNVSSIASAVNQSIQTITLPSFGVEPTVQQQPALGGAIEVATSTTLPFESLIEDKSFNITFRHTNGFMTYFLLLEHYIQYANKVNGNVPDYKTVPDIPLQITDVNKNVLFNFIFQGVNFIGLDELELSKALIRNEFSTFSARFRFNSFKLDFHTPERKTIHS